MSVDKSQMLGEGFGSAARRWRRGALRTTLAVVILTLFAGSMLFVDETEYVVVERLGRIVAVYDRTDAAHSDRGLHFKLPWPVETVRRFDRRLQIFDPPAREMFTADKKNLTVGSFLCWRIAEPDPASTALLERPVVKFFRGAGNIATAEARLDSRVRSILSSEMGRLELASLLDASAEQGPGDERRLQVLAQRVLELLRERDDEGESLADRLGIEVVDFGVKRINLPEANLFAVYERMRKEREKIAQRYRSAGEAEKLLIESQGRRQSDELLAKAESEAAKIQGEGEAEALRIRNMAQAKDPEFYELLRTLDGYRKMLNSRTTVVLSASSRLLKLLTEGVPADATSTAPPSNATEGQP
jgi:membrane protease subunit HflC